MQFVSFVSNNFSKKECFVISASVFINIIIAKSTIALAKVGIKTILGEKKTESDVFSDNNIRHYLWKVIDTIQKPFSFTFNKIESAISSIFSIRSYHQYKKKNYTALELSKGEIRRNSVIETIAKTVVNCAIFAFMTHIILDSSLQNKFDTGRINWLAAHIVLPSILSYCFFTYLGIKNKYESDIGNTKKRQADHINTIKQNQGYYQKILQAKTTLSLQYKQTQVIEQTLGIYRSSFTENRLPLIVFKGTNLEEQEFLAKKIHEEVFKETTIQIIDLASATTFSPKPTAGVIFIKNASYCSDYAKLLSFPHFKNKNFRSNIFIFSDTGQSFSPKQTLANLLEKRKNFDAPNQIYQNLPVVDFDSMSQDSLPSQIQLTLSRIDENLLKYNITLTRDENFNEQLLMLFRFTSTLKPLETVFKEILDDIFLSYDNLSCNEKNEFSLSLEAGKIGIKNGKYEKSFPINLNLNRFDFSDMTHFEEKLREKIIGQPHAIAKTVSMIQPLAIPSKTPPKKPVVLLYAGPTGVGKTELAKQLTCLLLKDESKMIFLPMNTNSEQHSVSTLIGSPAGYVGSEKEPEWLVQLQNNPYSIILLDEFEKAHDQVRKVFLQAFDEGFITGRDNQKYDCRRAIFIATTNCGSSQIAQSNGQSLDQIQKTLVPFLQQEFSSEVLGRMEVVLFKPIEKESIYALIEKEIQDCIYELKENRQIDLVLDQSVKNYLHQKDYDLKQGTRLIQREITSIIMTAISSKILTDKLEGDLKLEIYYDQENNLFTVKHILIKKENANDELSVD